MVKVIPTRRNIKESVLPPTKPLFYLLLTELDLIATLPNHRGMVVASQHLEWETQVADEEKLPMWLISGPNSFMLYVKFRFVAVEEVESDLSLRSGNSERGIYVHICMLRDVKA